MDEDDDVLIISDTLPKMDKNVELMTFNKSHQLQYNGRCNVTANEFQFSVVIDQEGEDSRYAPIRRQFIHCKNMLCILGPKKESDIIIFFKSEEYCNIIYNFIEKKKIKYKCIPPQHSVIKQLYEDRFLTPLKIEANKGQNERIMEILKIVQSEDCLVDDIKPSASAEDIKDVKPVVKTEPASNSTDTTTPLTNDVDETARLTADCLPNQNFSEVQRQSLDGRNSRKRSSPASKDHCVEAEKAETAQPPNKTVKEENKYVEQPMRKILYSSDFRLVEDKNAPSTYKEIHVFTSSIKDAWYKFLFDADKQKYYCDGCQKEGNLIEAEGHEQEGEHYLVLDDLDHICKEVTNSQKNGTVEDLDTTSDVDQNNYMDIAADQLANTSPTKNDKSEAIVKPPESDDNNKENQNLVPKINVSKVIELTFQTEPGSLENNPSTSEASFSFPPESTVRDYNPGEIFGPADIFTSSTTASTQPPSMPTANPPAEVNDGMPVLEQMITDTSSASEEPIIPCSTNNLATVSNANHYHMPMHQNIPNSAVVFAPFTVNGTSDVVYLPRPCLYTLPTSSPSIVPYTNSSMNASSTTPSTSINPVFYSNSFIPFTSTANTISPNFIMSPANRFMAPYTNQQVNQNPFTPNLASSYQNMSINSPQPNTHIRLSGENNRRPVNFNRSATPVRHNQCSSTMPLFNNSSGTRPTNQFTRYVNPNGMSSSQFPYQSLSSTPVTSTVNTSIRSSAGSNVVVSAAAHVSNPSISNVNNQNINPSLTSNLQPLNSSNITSSSINNMPSTSTANERNIPSNPGLPLSNGLSTSTSNNTQNVPPNSNSTLYASNVTNMSGIMIKGDKFSLRPNQKGVPNMKLDVQLPSGQIYSYNYLATQKVYSCEKCRQKGGKTTAKVCQLESGEICVLLDDEKHICTMPYTNEILLHDKYQVIGSDKAHPILIVFNSVNMDLGYEYLFASGNKFICKNCEKLKLGKSVWARVCVDQNDKQCIALNTDKHECKMQNFALNGRIIKPPYYKKIKNKNGEEEVIIYYEMKYRRFISEPSKNCFYCEGCKRSGRNTYIKLLHNQNGEEFVLVCGLHQCDPLSGFV